MLKLILLPLSFFFFLNCFAQYTAADYYDDNLVIQKINHYEKNNRIDSVLILMGELKGQFSAYDIKHCNQLLQQYDELEIQNLDSFYLVRLHNKLKETNLNPTPPNKLAIENFLNVLINEDRALVKFCDNTVLIGEITHDSILKVRRNITARFDSVCNAVGGWPSSYEYSIARSLILLIVHNSLITKSKLDEYFSAAAELCENQRENWNVALNILNVRKQYFASDLRGKVPISDTIVNVLDELPISENDIILPYLVYFGFDLSQKGSSVLKITTKNKTIGEEIRNAILSFKVDPQMPDEILQHLKDGGFDYPKPVTVDRIVVEVDARADKNVIYKFQ